MDNSRLAKQVYLKCKKFTDSLKESFCGLVKRTLIALKLDHLWRSEAVGDLKGWISFISTAIRRKDTMLWLEAMKKKPKLRLYSYLKSELVREDYIGWQIPASHRALYARLRSGTHQLRYETGRWVGEPEEERVCNVCVTGKVESEEHFLLDCYIYKPIREVMFLKIKEQTDYGLLKLKDDKKWLLDVLLGHGLQKKEVREKIGIAVTRFIAIALKIRRQVLSQSAEVEQSQ
jgi:hypothetical protein